MSLRDFARTIDRLYDDHHAGRVPGKRLLVIIGNGTHRIANILNDRDIDIEAKKRGYRPGSKKFREFQWRLFEYARYFTSYGLPTLAHVAIYQLVADGVCRDVVTTNYDLILDAIWAKYPELRVVQNPTLRKGQYDWDRFHSPSSLARGRPRYWKIHGSLSHVIFLGKRNPDRYQIHRLPRFPISTNQPDLAAYYKMTTLAPFLGYESQDSPLTAIAHPHELRSTFQPFIDWTLGNVRKPFAQEISTVRRLLRDPKQIAGILILGWRGGYDSSNPKDPWNEELVPEIMDILDKRSIPVMMAVHRKQFDQRHLPSSELLRRMHTLRRCFVYSRVQQFVTVLFHDYCRRFPFPRIVRTHDIWANNWFLPMKERFHA